MKRALFSVLAIATVVAVAGAAELQLTSATTIPSLPLSPFLYTEDKNGHECGCKVMCQPINDGSESMRVEDHSCATYCRPAFKRRES